MAHSHVIASIEPVQLTIRKIRAADLKDALAQGFDDFLAMPSYAVMLCLIYPVVALILARVTMGYDVLPLLFPLAAGFALLGPFAAVAFYEMSRQRGKGLQASWHHAFEVFHSPSCGAIAVLGVLLLVIFFVWLAVAQSIYIASFGYMPAASVPHFFDRIFTTPSGWTLIVVGNGVGFLFALGVFMISVFSFPLLLDHHVGAATALLASVRGVLANPAIMVAWGLIVAGLLLLGSLPFFIGLTVVLPVLGHATWHLYRKVVHI